MFIQCKKKKKKKRTTFRPTQDQSKDVDYLQLSIWLVLPWWADITQWACGHGSYVYGCICVHMCVYLNLQGGPARSICSERREVCIIHTNCFRSPFSLLRLC